MLGVQELPKKAQGVSLVCNGVNRECSDWSNVVPGVRWEQYACMFMPGSRRYLVEYRCPV